MEYVINVAKRSDNHWNGRHVHYFKVIVPYGNVRKVYEELKEKFPECHITVYQYQTTGMEIDIDKCTF